MFSRRPWWLIAAPAMFLFLWSGGYVVAKIALLNAPPMTLLVLRFSCVVAIMALLFVLFRPPLPKSAVDWGHLAIVGFLMQTVYFGMAYLIGYTAGLVGTLPFMLAMESTHINWTWTFAAALAYLVIGNSLIAVGLLLAMIRAGEVSKVSTLLFLVPPVAALMAWVVLEEIMPPVAWLGLALAGSGVFVATRKW